MVFLRSLLPRALVSAIFFTAPLDTEATGPGPGLNPAPRFNAPSASSVMFSTRFERPEARTVAAEFGATHFAWLYPRTRGYLADLTSRGLSVGTTLNANQPVPDEGLARDLEGKALVAPWMQSWGARWVSISSPVTRTAMLDAAQRHIAWGAESIQFDDPALATTSFGWGGDFSAAALQNFGAWLAGPGATAFPELPGEVRSRDAGNFDYRSWLARRGITTTSAYLQQRGKLPLNAAWERFHLEEVRNFFSTLRTTLHAAPKPVRLDLNLTNPRPDTRSFQLIDLADGVMSETSASDLANAALGAATVQSTGATYLPSLQPHDQTATRRQIAAFYALGALPLVPWDVYMPDLIGADKQRTPQPRYFGTVEQYGDLYRFVRNHPALFDGQQGLASVLLICQVENFKAMEVLSLVRQLQNRQIPFALMVARSSYPARALDAQRMALAPVVMFASSFSNLDAASEAALKSVESKRISVQELDTQRLRLAPVSVVEGPQVLVVPRMTPAQPHELILHLVRNDERALGAKKESLSVRLNPTFISSTQRIVSVESFSPDQAAQPIAMQDSVLKIPFDGDWSVLRIRLQ